MPVIKRNCPVVYGHQNQNIKEPLTGALLNFYDRNGYLFFDNLISAKEIEMLRREAIILQKTSKQDKNPRFITEPQSGEVRSVFEIHRNVDIFSQLVKSPKLLAVAQQILNSDLYIHQSRINYKPGFYGKEFYWHSDFETWHTEDGMPHMRALSCSISLTDNYHFNGPLMVIPGSHNQFVPCEGTTPENHYKKSLKKQEYGVPSRESLMQLIRQGGIEIPVGSAGSVLFFDCNLMHGSNGNITPYSRTNIFFVYNSVENKLVEPFGAERARPEFIAAREYAPIIN